ncbi:MAG: hypothetical protein HC849_02325 [Oscillatoriales cyanobacterium RU_3_3]|nr:hypothetical protein [Oscillatoriales cyanobacterium RU_3_3]
MTKKTKHKIDKDTKSIMGTQESINEGGEAYKNLEELAKKVFASKYCIQLGKK